MNKVELHINVRRPFGNLFRKKAVLIVVENGRGQFLVGAKPQQYPPGITRLLGGGVNEGETEADAAARELHEELGVELDVDELQPLLAITVSAKDDEAKLYAHETYVYYANIGDKDYRPGDDVKGIQLLSIDELYELGNMYESLPETLWYNGPEGMYSWSDYAKLYAPVHKLSSEAVKALKKGI